MCDNENVRRYTDFEGVQKGASVLINVAKTHYKQNEKVHMHNSKHHTSIVLFGHLQDLLLILEKKV